LHWPEARSDSSGEASLRRRCYLRRPVSVRNSAPTKKREGDPQRERYLHTDWNLLHRIFSLRSGFPAAASYMRVRCCALPHRHPPSPGRSSAASKFCNDTRLIVQHRQSPHQWLDRFSGCSVRSAARAIRPTNSATQHMLRGKRNARRNAPSVPPNWPFGLRLGRTRAMHPPCRIPVKLDQPEDSSSSLDTALNSLTRDSTPPFVQMLFHLRRPLLSAAHPQYARMRPLPLFTRMPSGPFLALIALLAAPQAGQLHSKALRMPGRADD